LAETFARVSHCLLLFTEFLSLYEGEDTDRLWNRIKRMELAC